MNQKGVTIKVTSRDVNWSRFVKIARSFKDMRTEIGLPNDNKFTTNASSRIKTYKQLIMIALILEFGAPNKNIPERALFRITFDSQQKYIQRKMNAGARDVFLGKKTIEQVLSEIGDYVVEKLQNNIMRKMPPPNAPRTVSRKHFNHPLLESGTFYANLHHREVKGVRV